MEPLLIDIGLNLTHDSFDQDRAQVVQDAWDAGVRQAVLTGSTLEGSRRAIELAAAAPAQFRTTAGVHPHHAHEFADADIDALAGLLSHPMVAAAGECGLDYFRNFSPHADQQRVFRAQLALATRARKPVFLHQRDAHDDFLQILRDYRGLAGVAHCFTGDAKELHAYLDHGLYIGITGWICDERRGQQLQQMVADIPLDRLLVETDAPYLLPRNLTPKPRTRRNEPKYLPHIVAELARHRGESFAKIAEATTRNARTLFAWPAEPAGLLPI
jgi:TatD DNase family protein